MLSCECLLIRSNWIQNGLTRGTFWDCIKFRILQFKAVFPKAVTVFLHTIFPPCHLCFAGLSNAAGSAAAFQVHPTTHGNYMPCALDPHQVNHTFRAATASTAHGYYHPGTNSHFQTNIGHPTAPLHPLNHEYQLQSAASQPLHSAVGHHKPHLENHHQNVYKGVLLSQLCEISLISNKCKQISPPNSSSLWWLIYTFLCLHCSLLHRL